MILISYAWSKNAFSLGWRYITRDSLTRDSSKCSVCVCVCRIQLFSYHVRGVMKTSHAINAKLVFNPLATYSHNKIGFQFCLKILWMGFPWWCSSKESACQSKRQKRCRVQSLGQEDHLEEDMATHSGILTWEMPWMEVPGGLQPMGSRCRTQLTQLWQCTTALLLHQNCKQTFIYWVVDGLMPFPH